MPAASNAKRIARIIPALTARTQFGQILKRAGQGRERFVVERRGEPGVVIMGIDEYLRNFMKPGSIVDEIHEYVRKMKLRPLTKGAINREIKLARRESQRNRKNG